MVVGGSGNDRIRVGGDGATDNLDCGDGPDVVYSGPGDTVDGDCESIIVMP